MKARFSIAPDRFDTRHHNWKKGREELLQIISNIKIFLFWLAHNRCRIDRILSMVESGAVENRKIMLQAVVAIMVSKRALQLPLMRLCISHEREFTLAKEG